MNKPATEKGKTKGGWLRRRLARNKDVQPPQANERTQQVQRQAQERIQAENEQAKAKVQQERIAAVQLRLRDRRAARKGDPTPIEIVFEKGKHMRLSPDDRIRNAGSVQAAAQTLQEMFAGKGDVLATQPQQISETEWTFDADFLHGALHCTLTRRGDENTARYLLTDWTPDIWQEMETTIPAVLGAVKISDSLHCAFSILCEVRDADDPQKMILWVEDAFGREKDKHAFVHRLVIYDHTPEREAQTSARQNRDDWEDYHEAVDRYSIFKNDRFPVFYTNGSDAFCGYMFMSWYALAVSANGALYMEAEYDEPWEMEEMSSTELTDAFVEDIVYAYEQKYKRKLKAVVSYADREYMGGRYGIITIEPDTQAQP